MCYVGLDVQKKTISYCVKDVAGGVHQEGKNRLDPADTWIRTWLRTTATTIFWQRLTSPTAGDLGHPASFKSRP